LAFVGVCERRTPDAELALADARHRPASVSTPVRRADRKQNWLYILRTCSTFGLGRLPGDIVVEREGFSLYIPIVTSLLISAVLTLLFWLFGR
jgi:hypothetical protein